VFTARYALSPYITQIRVVFKGLVVGVIAVFTEGVIIFVLIATKYFKINWTKTGKYR
jgi:hypothetical protein